MLARVAAVAALSLVHAASTPSLAGAWADQGGKMRVRIAACAGSPGTLCATVLGTNRTVVTGLLPSGLGQWKGRYVADAMNLVATMRLSQHDVAAMTACRLMFCQTVSYRREH